MTDVHKLLQDVIDADRQSNGEADPAPYLARVSGTDRAELEALIDGYLARAPRRRFDAAAFDASPARDTAEALWRSLEGAGGTWPAVLPRLRHRAQITRHQLVRRLAESLGVADRETKVAAYSHAMERGALPAEGVSDRVLEALGRIVGEQAGRLRELGRTAAGGHATTDDAALMFARTATPDPQFAEEPIAASASAPATQHAGEPFDEVDELFTGASDR